MSNAPQITMRKNGEETPMFLSAKVCEWTRDGDGGYYVKCGDFRVIMQRQRDSDDKAEHNFAFCPYCGGKLIVTINAGVGVKPAKERKFP